MPNFHMSSTAGALLFSTCAALLWWSNATQHPDSALTPKTDKAVIAQDFSLQPSQKTIADAWQWPPAVTTSQPASGIAEQTQVSAADYRFNPVAVHAALRGIKLDSYGDVVADADALNALYDAFNQGDLILDDDAITELQNIIRASLPPQPGAQAAEIVSNFNAYLRAKKEMLSVMDASESALDEGVVYDEIVALREMLLGTDVASGLFAEEDANARHVMESMRLEQNKSLSQAEKSQRQQAIAERYAGAENGISDWDQRLQQFRTEKQTIEAAGYSRVETEYQVQALLHLHFNPQEITQLAYLNLAKI